MKSYSDDIPRPIWVRYVNDGIAHVCIRRGAREVPAPSAMDGKPGRTQYEYDEVNIELPDRPHLDIYLFAHHDELMDIELAKEGVIVPSKDERIAALEGALLDLMGASDPASKAKFLAQQVTLGRIDAAAVEALPVVEEPVGKIVVR